jgi:hypothetical protein
MATENEGVVSHLDSIIGTDRRNAETASCAETRAWIGNNVPPAEFQRISENITEAAPILATRILGGYDLPEHEPDAVLDLMIVHQLIEKVREPGVGGYALRYERAFAWAAQPTTTLEAAALFSRRFSMFRMTEEELRAFGKLHTTDAYLRVQGRLSPALRSHFQLDKAPDAIS